MGDQADLLELLHRAHASFRTVRGVAREWSDVVLEERALEANPALNHPGNRGFDPHAEMLMRYGAKRGTEAFPARIESRLRFWVERPARGREEWESASPNGRHALEVRDGEQWWDYHPGRGAWSGVDGPVFQSGATVFSTHSTKGKWMERLTDPAGMLAGFELVVDGESEQAGRPVLVVRATPRQPPNSDREGGGLAALERGGGGDEYRLLVDSERGILLRRANLLGGQELSVSEIDEVTFDEQFPETTFTLELPEGEAFETQKFEPVDREPVTLEEAAARASFRVLALPRLPEGNWRTTVVLTTAYGPPPTGDAVEIDYMREDAARHVHLRETALGGEDDDTTFADCDIIERAGTHYRVFRRERLVGRESGMLLQPSLILFDREQTAVRLSSKDLPFEQLLDLAQTLTPI